MRLRKRSLHDVHFVAVLGSHHMIFICRWRCDGTVDVQSYIFCEQFLSASAPKLQFRVHFWPWKQSLNNVLLFWSFQSHPMILISFSWCFFCLLILQHRILYWQTPCLYSTLFHPGFCDPDPDGTVQWDRCRRPAHGDVCHAWLYVRKVYCGSGLHSGTHCISPGVPVPHAQGHLCHGGGWPVV